MGKIINLTIKKINARRKKVDKITKITGKRLRESFKASFKRAAEIRKIRVKILIITVKIV